MAKKSISDIVLRAVVDTSGVAAGLNSIGNQVAGRTYGTGQGGPTGAAGAAGGFVSPYGAAPGGLAAAGAAGAAAGIALGRGGRARWAKVLEQAAKDRIDPEAYATYSMRSKIAGAGRISSRLGRDYFPGGTLSAILAGDAGISGNERADLLRQRFERAREQGLARRQMLAENSKLRYMRMQRMTGGLYGSVSQGISAINRSSTRLGALMGLGRFAPLGVPGLALGAATLGGSAAVNLADSMYGRYQDISRFQVGADRLAASQLRRTWTPAGQKAPLSFMDRLLIEGRKANQGQATALENMLGAVGQMKQAAAAEVGRATAGDIVSMSQVLLSTSPVTSAAYQGYLNMKRLLAG